MEHLTVGEEPGTPTDGHPADRWAARGRRLADRSR